MSGICFHFGHLRGYCILIIRYFVYYGLRREGMPALLIFCRKLAWKLINNIYIWERNGGVEFLPDSIHWLMTTQRHARIYKNQRYICTVTLPINNTTAALNAVKYKDLLRMHPRTVDM